MSRDNTIDSVGKVLELAKRSNSFDLNLFFNQMVRLTNKIIRLSKKVEQQKEEIDELKKELVKQKKKKESLFITFKEYNSLSSVDKVIHLKDFNKKLERDINNII